MKRFKVFTVFAMSVRISCRKVNYGCTAVRIWVLPYALSLFVGVDDHGVPSAIKILWEVEAGCGEGRGRGIGPIVNQIGHARCPFETMHVDTEEGC